jgi:hypothetical protein
VNSKQFNELKMLAEKLPLVPEERFNMSQWATGDQETDCGFAGCAIGWAPKLIPNCGLRFGPDVLCPFCMSPYYQDETGYNAVATYFGINYVQSLDLFYPHSYAFGATPKDVSKRILQFLAGEKVEDGSTSAC